MTWQKRERPDPALFIGRGKVQELSLLRQEKGANLIILMMSYHLPSNVILKNF